MLALGQRSQRGVLPVPPSQRSVPPAAPPAPLVPPAGNAAPSPAPLPAAAGLRPRVLKGTTRKAKARLRPRGASSPHSVPPGPESSAAKELREQTNNRQTTRAERDAARARGASPAARSAFLPEGRAERATSIQAGNGDVRPQRASERRGAEGTAAEPPRTERSGSRTPPPALGSAPRGLTASCGPRSLQCQTGQQPAQRPRGGDPAQLPRRQRAPREPGQRGRGQ